MKFIELMNRFQLELNKLSAAGKISLQIECLCICKDMAGYPVAIFRDTNLNKIVELTAMRLGDEVIVCLYDMKEFIMSKPQDK